MPKWLNAREIGLGNDCPLNEMTALQNGCAVLELLCFIPFFIIWNNEQLNQLHVTPKNLIFLVALGSVVVLNDKRSNVLIKVSLSSLLFFICDFILHALVSYMRSGAKRVTKLIAHTYVYVRMSMAIKQTTMPEIRCSLWLHLHLHKTQTTKFDKSATITLR